MHYRTLSIIAGCAVSLGLSAADPAPETVLVKRGDVQVTVGDFQASLTRLDNDEQRFAYRTDVHRITTGLSSLYLARVLANEARAAGIDKEPDVQRRLKVAEEQLLTQILLERFEKSIKTPDFEARAREIYKADPARFTEPERAQFRHILVSFQGRTQEEARRRAEEARQKLLAGENFTRTAREYSNDPTFRANDGAIGPVPYTSLTKELAQGVRTAPIGKTSDLIKSSDGYHVVMVEARFPSVVIPFEKAKKALIEDDEFKYRRGIVAKKMADITTAKDITLYTDEIAMLRTEVDRPELRKLHEEEAAREAAAREELVRKQKALEEAAAKKGG